MPTLTKSFVVREFSCLAGDCPDTCCKIWQMQVDQKTLNLYEKHAPELLESVEFSSSQKHTVMKRREEDNHCVRFVGGICGIHRDFGENYLGDACYFYPRVTRRMGGKVYMSAVMSCPETARLAIIEGKIGKWAEGESERLPESLKNYLHEGDFPILQGMPEAIMRLFVGRKGDVYALATALLQLAGRLDESPKESWAGLLPAILERRGEDAKPASIEIYKVVNALAILVYGSKVKVSGRLREVVGLVEGALGIVIDFDNARILAAAAGAKNLEEVREEFTKVDAEKYLRNYLLASLEFTLFPFSGLGKTVFEKAAIIVFRMALMRIFILSASIERTPSDDEIVKIIQSISRVIDHLESDELLLKIFEDNGWKTAEDFAGLVAL